MAKYFSDGSYLHIDYFRWIFPLHCFDKFKPLDSKYKIALAFEFWLDLEILYQSLIRFLEYFHPLSFQLIDLLSFYFYLDIMPNAYHLQLLCQHDVISLSEIVDLLNFKVLKRY